MEIEISIFDADGYLTDTATWDETIARQLATQESVELNNSTLCVIQTLRDYYLSHQQMPRFRELITLLRVKPGMEGVNSALLHQWFPLNVTLQMARIAGLPKPKRCM